MYITILISLPTIKKVVYFQFYITNPKLSSSSISFTNKVFRINFFLSILRYQYILFFNSKIKI